MKRKTVFFIALVLCTLPFTVPAYAQPSSENCEIHTFVNTPAYGTLKSDTDNCVFYVTTEPVKGELRLDSDGYYCYIPDTNRRGKDYFGFRVRDEAGNISQEATVIIRIERIK